MKVKSRKTTKKDEFKSMYMKDHPVPYEGATPDETVETLAKEYSAWFRKGYGSGLNKTAWHFFSYVFKVFGNPDDTTGAHINALVSEFRRACADKGASATWCNAIRWWILDEEGLV